MLPGYIKSNVSVLLLIALTASFLSCKKNSEKIVNSSYSISGETIALAGQNPSYLLKRDAKVNAVYKIGKDSTITRYQEGSDYVLTGDGGIKRTANSSIPDFSAQKVVLNANGKFTFAPDPNRNPQPSIIWQIMVDYATAKDSLITSQSAFLSAKLKNKLKNKSDIAIYCIGTSITAGAHTVPVYYDDKNTAVYVQLIARAITALYGNKVTVVNIAEGGADAILFTKKLGQIKAANPDLVFVEFGMNEHILSGNMDTYLNAIENGTKTLNGYGIDCALVGFFQQNPQWEMEVPASTVYFNDKLREIGARNNVFFADIYNAFAKLPQDKLYRDLTGDYMHHPTDFGHKIYYLATMPLLLFESQKESDLLKLIQTK